MGAIQLFLALVVVFDHTRSIALSPKHLDVDVFYALGFNAGYAVMFFFIISGFLISYVLHEKYPATANGAANFYTNRFIRIFSLYWPLAAVVMLASPAQNWIPFVNADVLDKFTKLFLFGIDWNLAFRDYPDQNTGAGIWALGQAWTLGPELTFYLCAPLLLRNAKAVLFVFAASALVRGFAVWHYGIATIWTYQFFPATVLFFMLGDLARRVSARLRLSGNAAVGFVSFPACCALLMFPTYASWDTARFWTAVTIFALGLPAQFEATKNVRLLNALGDLSYPVHLVHLFVILELLDRGRLDRAEDLAGAPGAVGLVIAVSVVLAIVVHRVLEIPLAAAMRASLKLAVGRLHAIKP